MVKKKIEYGPNDLFFRVFKKKIRVYYLAEFKIPKPAIYRLINERNIIRPMDLNRPEEKAWYDKIRKIQDENIKSFIDKR